MGTACILWKMGFSSALSKEIKILMSRIMLRIIRRAITLDKFACFIGHKGMPPSYQRQKAISTS